MKKVICSICALAVCAAGILCMTGCTNNPSEENPTEAESVVSEMETE